uniref:Initiator protein NS1 n=1 Tax=Cutavirus TaxID=1867125 RepID=A0A1B0VC01_9VIRU|nr:NS1 [Cutavirus]
MALSKDMTNAIEWLKQKRQKLGLSFVFKINELQFKPTPDGQFITINWKEYRKNPRNDEIKQVIELDQQTVSNRNGEENNKINVMIPPHRNAIILTGITKKILFDYFKIKQIEPNEVDWFIQSELGTDTGLHIHVLIASDKINNHSGKWMVKYFAEKWGLYLITILAMDNEHLKNLLNQTKFRKEVEQKDWVSVLQYTHQQTKKKYCKTINFGEMIANYFLIKKIAIKDKDHGYIYSIDSGFKLNNLSFNERYLVAKHCQQLFRRDTDTELTTTKPQDKKKKRLETAREISIKETVQSLYTNRYHTREKWMLGDPDTYIQQIAQPGGEQACIAILDIVTLKMANEKTAFELIMEKEIKKKAKQTKAWKLIKNNNMNPKKVYHAIMCCLNKQMGKRNTILLCGPASTGKSLISQTIANLVGNVGCYNPSNANFPFNDCSNKNLIWIEEAGNFGTQVNSFKAIMSGQAIRLDQKGKGSKQIEPTPVIMTTNEDITKVIVGTELKTEHRQPIMDRCLRFELKHKLPGDHGLLHNHEIPTIFKYLELHGFYPTMKSYIERWETTPTWGENWNTKAKEASSQLPDEEREDEEHTPPNSPIPTTQQQSLAESLDPDDQEFAMLLKDIEETERALQTIPEEETNTEELAATGYGQPLISGTDVNASY